MGGLGGGCGIVRVMVNDGWVGGWLRHCSSYRERWVGCGIVRVMVNDGWGVAQCRGS